MGKENTLEIESNPTAQSESVEFENPDERNERLKREHEVAMHERNLGVLGQYFGGSSEKAGNIAAVVAILSLFIVIAALIAAVFVTNPELSDTLSTIVASCASLVSGAMGYIFGSRSSN